MNFHKGSFLVQALFTCFIFEVAHCTGIICTVKGDTADCSHRSLFTIPTINDRKIKILNLAGNTLNTLKSRSFAITPLLTNLSIASSEVSVLDKDTFTGLTNLTWLDLGHNGIKVLDDIFNSDLKNLEYLYLQYNSIARIPQNCLDLLVKLKKLHLEHNKLTIIHPHAFNKLVEITWISLDHNSLTTANSAWFSPINKTLTYISLGYNPWLCDHKMCGFKNWTQLARKRWNPKMIQISCSHTNKTLKDFHTKTLCRGNVLEVAVGHDVILPCLNDRSTSWQYMTKSSKPLITQKIVNNGKTSIKPGKLFLSSAQERDAGKYCCLDVPVDDSSPTPAGGPHVSPHCIILKVKVAHPESSNGSGGGGSGGTVAIVIILILAAVGGVSFWYFRRKRRNYGLLSDETVFQPSYDDPVESVRIQQHGTDETGLSEAYV